MRKHTKRRIYELVNPIKHAMEGAAFTSQQHLDALRIRELAAIEAFAKGQATVREWHEMTAMLNLAEMMAKRGIGPEVLVACQKAQEALIEAQQRFEKTKRMGTTGVGLQALRDLYEFHDLQRQSVARSEYESAIKAMTNRIRSKAPEVVELS